nr:GNAT family N-acetyltransferase [uncultured Sellimonas sp.]
MTICRTAKPEEREKIVKLANEVFRTDFETIIPKVYYPQDRSFEMTKIVENEEGEVAAEAALLLQDWYVGGRKLQTGFLGTVCVAPKERGKGYMKAVVNSQIEEMNKKIQLSVLAGQRQRYEYFGYTTGGIVHKYTVNEANVKHGLCRIDTEGISFLPLFEVPGAESQAFFMNEKKKVYVKRNPEFLRKILVTYGYIPMAVLHENDMIGYVLKNKDDTMIAEIEVMNTEDIGRIVKAYFRQFKCEEVDIRLPQYDVEKNRIFSSFAERCVVTSSGMYRIFDFVAVLEAFLNVKFQTVGLSGGRFSAIMDQQPVTIEVNENGVSVTQEAEEDAVVLDRKQAQTLLLTSFGTYMGIEVPADWFPLPLFWSYVDGF